MKKTVLWLAGWHCLQRGWWMSPVSECQTFRLSGRDVISSWTWQGWHSQQPTTSSENITDQVRGKVILEADFTIQFTVEARGVTVTELPTRYLRRSKSEKSLLRTTNYVSKLLRIHYLLTSCHVIQSCFGRLLQFVIAIITQSIFHINKWDY